MLPSSSQSDSSVTAFGDTSITQTIGGITKTTGVKTEYLLIAGVIIAVLLLKKRKK